MNVYDTLMRSGGQTQVDKFRQDVAAICMHSMYSWKDTRKIGEQARLSGEFPLSDLRPCLSQSMYAQVHLDRKWRGFSKVWDSEFEDGLKKMGFTIRKPLQKAGQFVLATYIGIGDGWPISLEQFARMHSQNNPELAGKVEEFVARLARPSTLYKSQWESQFTAECDL